jgi:hypothetical protein
MRTQRQVVDYSLQKRALLREVLSGRVGTYEVCDASPYLKNAARFHGEPIDRRCPICRRENLTLVHYIYGDELKQSAGQARTLTELPVLAMTFREFQVYVVEVCRGCDWNHLVEQFLLGRDGLSSDDSTPESVAAGGRLLGRLRRVDRHPLGLRRAGVQTKARGPTVTSACPSDNRVFPKWRGERSLVNRISPNMSGNWRAAKPAAQRVLTHRTPVVSQQRATATGRV